MRTCRSSFLLTYPTPALRRFGHNSKSCCIFFARVDGVIAATPLIYEKLSRANENTVIIRNYPLVSEFDSPQSPDLGRTSITYVGNISESRGVLELLEAVDLCVGRYRWTLLADLPSATSKHAPEA